MTDLLAVLSNALVDRYRVERELGRGGMATVYLAHDRRHERPVALKVLKPDLGTVLGAERFLREIRLAARLQHPHILPLFDSGETAGLLWYAMPYVEGETLRDRLSHEKQLPLAAALRIADQVLSALGYAHAHGVVHRDIKPENILLADDQAVVTDFGIARAVSAAGGERLTDTGLALGTPAYMSPEQSTGARDLDRRSDIYSLGVVLYEMLAGEPPFTGPTVQALIARRLSEAPRPLRQARETVPPCVEQTLMTALAKSPADRFQTAQEFARALARASATAPDPETRPAGSSPDAATVRVRPRSGMPVSLPLVALALLLAIGALIGLLRRPGGAADDGGARRVAVLPFENLGRPEDEYFADGVTDEIRGKLAALPGLQVTASNSSNQYKRTSKPPRQIGQELGVQYLLVGKVRWEKGVGQSRVRVSPELVDVASASTRWQQPFDASLTDVFQVQADIAGRVAQALGIALGSGERERLAERPTTNLTAYDLYLQGNEVASGFDLVAPVELRRAIGLYERAVALDSAFALAWAQLSRAHAILYYIGTPTTADADGARVGAERAVALNPRLAEAHLALADYYNYVRKDWASALAEYAAGRRIAPRNADLLRGSALVARSQGRWEQSLAALEEALSLDPRSIATARRLTYALLWLRRYPAALSAADRALELDRHDPALHENKAMVYLAEGDLPNARAVLQTAQQEVEPTALVAWMATYWDLYWVLDDAQQQLLLRLPPGPFGDDRLLWGLALAGTYALRGDSSRARACADSARIAGESEVREAPDDGQRHALLGTALAYLGRKADAIRQGQRAVALLPVAKDANLGAYVQHQLARIYILLNESERALDQLEPLLRIPYELSPGWLRVDPTFAPLKGGNPRFQRLAAGR